MLDVSNVRKNEKERPWYKYAYKLISNESIKDNKVIDIWAWLWEWSDFLSNNWYIIEKCLEWSTNYINNLKSKWYKAIQADLNNKLPLESNSVNAITLLEVIEHIENAEDLIDEIYRILKPWWKLIISTPNIAYIWLRLKWLFWFPPPDEWYHYRFFTFNSLKKKLESAWFKYKNHASFTFLHWIHKLLRINPITIPIPFYPQMFAIKSVIICEK